MTWPSSDAYTVTSGATFEYNCLAWAIGTDLVWLWPPGDDALTTAGTYWPANLKHHELSVAAIEEFLELFGYVRTDEADLDDSLERVVLYVQDTEPTHVARMIPGDAWTSKLGPQADVAHDIPEDVAGGPYGDVRHVYQRRESVRVEDVLRDPVVRDAMERTVIRRGLIIPGR